MKRALYRGLLAVTLAAGTFCTAIPISASAITEQVFAGYRGDINCNGIVEVSDAVALAKHLHMSESISDAVSADRADMDQNDVLNAIDLTLLKRALYQQAFEEIYETVESPTA